MFKYIAVLTLLLVASPAFAKGSGDSGLGFIAILGGIAVLYGFISNHIDNRVKKGIDARIDDVQRAASAERERTERAANVERQKIERVAQEANQAIEQKVADLVRLQQAFSQSYVNGRQWLAEYIAEAFGAQEIALANSMERKKNPATKAADEIRRVSAEKRELRTKLKHLEYVIKTYHEYYPVLEEYSEDILNEQATLELEGNEPPDADRVARYISQEEYSKLPIVQRNQLALDKWKARRKSNVEIGRIYERYLGYLYEKHGWQVTFIGALEGIEDMGRDLLCVRDDKVHVVQAKYWSKHRAIHEKHIF